MIKVATAFSGGFGSIEIALKYLNIEKMAYLLFL